jgi:phage tail tape-measure protein
MLQAQHGYQDYYRNLGLSLANKQPVQQAQPVGYTNQMAGYTPQGAMNFAQQGYGSYANLYGSMYNTNAQMEMANNPMNMISNFIPSFGFNFGGKG